jgi:plastocyanin
MRPAALGLGLLALGCGTVAAAGARTEPGRAANQVRITEFRFAPAELTVGIGDTVVWTNDDALLHTASADSGAWSSPEMRRGEAFRYVALRAGRFPYHCAAHPVMRATLVVRP